MREVKDRLVRMPNKHTPTSYRCLKSGRKSYYGEGSDRSNLCRRCVEKGYNAQGCVKAPKCLVCACKKQVSNHVMDGPSCPLGEANIKKSCK